MKYLYLIYVSIFLCSIVSCKNEDSNSKNRTTTTNHDVESKHSLSQIDESKYYISAESGLNYRETPKGKISGKFLLNEIVTVLRRTGLFEDIKDDEKLIKGEWVGVEKDGGTVYVFDGFLSKEKLFLDENVTQVMVDYYNENYGKGLVLVETKSDSLRGLSYLTKPEGEDDYGWTQMSVSIPRKIDEKYIYYGDLDNDGLKDMIVPVNTEGGGGGGNVWWVDLFVYLKKGNAYEFVTVKSNWEISGCPDYGFIFIDKIENNIIYGESSCYAEEDGRCCPSLTYHVELKLEDKDFIVLNKTKLKKTAK